MYQSKIFGGNGTYPPRAIIFTLILLRSKHLVDLRVYSSSSFCCLPTSEVQTQFRKCLFFSLLLFFLDLSRCHSSSTFDDGTVVLFALVIFCTEVYHHWWTDDTDEKRDMRINCFGMHRSAEITPIRQCRERNYAVGSDTASAASSFLRRERSYDHDGGRRSQPSLGGMEVVSLSSMATTTQY